MLNKADLSGGVFEDLWVRYKLVGANLSNTVWRRCDFDRTDLSQADLTGARFEDCHFSDAQMVRANLSQAGFVRCQLSLRLEGANVQGATFAELEVNPVIDLSKARASKMKLQASVFDVSRIPVKADGADLKGAELIFDLEAEKRKELEKKPNPKLKWAETHFKGAKTDDHTRIVFTPLPGAKQQKGGRPAPASFEGPAAISVGRIDAINASLWLVLSDGHAAREWHGTDQGEFDRAMALEEGPITMGAQRGVVAQVGDCGWSHLWKLDDGLALLSHRPSGHVTKMPKPKYLAELGARVAQMAAKAKFKRVGTLEVTSGCLALMLPYTDGSFSDKQLQAAKGKVVMHGDDRALIPLPNGHYQVLWSDDSLDDDELGKYGNCLRIVQAKGTAAVTPTRKPPSSAKRAKPRR